MILTCNGVGGLIAGRPVSCKTSSLTLFDGHRARLPCPSENGKKQQARKVHISIEVRTMLKCCHVCKLLIYDNRPAFL